MNMEERIKAVYDAVIETIATYGLDILGAIVILIVGMMVAGWAQRAMQLVALCIVMSAWALALRPGWQGHHAQDHQPDSGIPGQPCCPRQFG